MRDRGLTSSGHSQRQTDSPIRQTDTLLDVKTRRANITTNPSPLSNAFKIFGYILIDNVVVDMLVVMLED